MTIIAEVVLVAPVAAALAEVALAVPAVVGSVEAASAVPVEAASAEVASAGAAASEAPVEVALAEDANPFHPYKKLPLVCTKGSFTCIGMVTFSLEPRSPTAVDSWPEPSARCPPALSVRRAAL